MGKISKNKRNSILPKFILWNKYANRGARVTVKVRGNITFSGVMDYTLRRHIGLWHSNGAIQFHKIRRVVSISIIS